MELFDFIDKDKNDLISNFDNNDISMLLNLLKLYKISLRDNLGLKDNITFGFEYEFGALNEKLIESFVKSYNYKCIREKRIKNNGFYNFKKEGTINNGFEVTTPIYKDTIDTWLQVTEMCSFLLRENAYTTNETAGHIHLGMQIIDNEPSHWINFFKLYTAYENILFRFGYGEYEKERFSAYIYSQPLSELYYKRLLEFKKRNYNISLEELLVTMQFGYKKYALGIHKYVKEDTSYRDGKTIEFRNFNASLEPVIWQNNLNFIVHFIEYCKSDKFNHDLVNKRLDEKTDSFSILENYNQIKLNEAIELSDMIFDNNLDKLNFLRQYLKSFKVKNEFIISDKFIKSLHM